MKITLPIGQSVKCKSITVNWKPQGLESENTCRSINNSLSRPHEPFRLKVGAPNCHCKPML